MSLQLERSEIFEREGLLEGEDKLPHLPILMVDVCHNSLWGQPQGVCGLVKQRGQGSAGGSRHLLSAGEA